MSTVLAFDSITPQQVYNLTLAFQRTAGLLRDGNFGGYAIPSQITVEPTVTVGGSSMGWKSPRLTPAHVVALLAEYDRLERGVFGGPTADTAAV